MKGRNIVLATIATITLFSFVAFATYSYLNVSSLSITNAANTTATSEKNNMVFDSSGGLISLNITAGSMTQASNNTLSASNTSVLRVNFTANSSLQYTCTYDIVWEWLSSNKYTAHTSNVAAFEFTIQGSLATNTHANEGINHIKNEVDLSDAVYTSASAVVVKGAQIDSTGTTTNTAVWTLTSRYYNVNADQSAHAGKTYSGRFKVSNVSCVPGALDNSNTLVKYLVNTAPKSGTDAVANAPWYLMMDVPGDWRYTGKNPNNYITFNGELWRIVGIMNMTYCKGTFGDTSCSQTATDELVKIVRNASEGTMAWDSTNSKNKWQASSLKALLQNKSYASDSHVAVAKWGLYGTTTAAKAPYIFYQIEYLGTGGATYSGNPTYWYGKVGVMAMSDFGRATSGNNAPTGTYSRENCISRSLGSWTSTYKTHCSLNSWIGFNDVTSTAPSAGVAWWSMAQISGGSTNVLYITAAGISASIATTNSNVNVRPAVYLKPDTLISGTHTGTYNDPYQIS